MNIPQNKSIMRKVPKYILIYIMIISFCSSNVYAASPISPMGSFIKHEPPEIGIENFLSSTRMKESMILKKNQKMIDNLNNQIEQGNKIIVQERVNSERFVQQKVQEAAGVYDEAFAVNKSEGVNDDGTRWTRYSGKSVIQIKSVLDLAGLSEFNSESSTLKPKGDHIYSWSLMVNYQQSDSSKVKFRLTVNDKSGLSESTFSMVREKVFEEDEEEAGEEGEEKSDGPEAKSGDEESEDKESSEESELSGEFHWVDKKIFKTDIKHQTGSRTYANNKTEAYDFITNFHEKIIYLNNNKILERDVESEFDIDKKVAVLEHSKNYEYNSETGSKEKAHIYEITREMSPEDYIKSSKEDGGWLAGKYKETIIDNRAPDKITEKFVDLSYDEEDRIAERISVVNERSDSGLDNWYATVENNFSYLSVDNLILNQTEGYNSIQLGGDLNSKDEALGLAEKIAGLNPDNISLDSLPDKVKLQLQKIDHIKYNEEGNQRKVEGHAKVLGKDGDNVLKNNYDFVRDSFQYDDMDRVAGNKERIFNNSANPDKEVVKTISDIEYDYKGLEKSHYEEIHEKGPGLDKLITKEVKDRQYNRLGQIVSYTDIIRDSSAPDKTITNMVSDIEYNEDGLQKEYFQETNEKGPGLDKTVTTHKTEMNYNSLEQLLSYTDIVHDSSAPDKTITNMVSDIEYNESGKQKAYSQETNEKGPGLDKTVIIDKSDMVYNDLGQLVSYINDIHDLSAPDKTTTSYVSDIKYNKDGLQTAYFQETNEEGPGLDKIVTLEKSDMVYNDLGQLVSYIDITNDLGIDEETTTEVTNITYNDVGQKKSYTQEERSEDDIVTYKDIELTYNSLGFRETQVEEGWEEGVDDNDDYYREFERTTNFTYDEKGRVVKTDIESWDSESSSLTTYTTTEILEFNSIGQPVSTYTTLELEGDGISRSGWKKKENIEYDDHGDEEEWDEESGGDVNF